MVRFFCVVLITADLPREIKGKRLRLRSPNQNQRQNYCYSAVEINLINRMRGLQRQ